MNLRFNSMVKHNRLAFSPGPVYAVTDETAAAYFVAMGWAEETADAVDFDIDDAEVTVNPDTVYGDGPSKGQRVLPEA